jgi:hypothetical protein
MARQKAKIRSGAMQKRPAPGQDNRGVKGAVKVRVVPAQDGKDAKSEAYRLLAEFFRRRERGAGEAG